MFPYAPLLGGQLARVRQEAGETLSGLGRQMGLENPAVEVIGGSFVARELQDVTERGDTGLIVVGSTTRGPIGRLLVGGVGERLLYGAASPVAIAPRGYNDAPPPRLQRIGVGVDGSEEAQRALEAAVALARNAEAAIRVITAFQPLAFGSVTTSPLPSISEGSADDVLLAEGADLDLLVTGSRGYGPVGAVLMGSATAALARGSACPILVTPRGTRFELLDRRAHRRRGIRRVPGVRDCRAPRGGTRPGPGRRRPTGGRTVATIRASQSN